MQTLISYCYNLVNNENYYTEDALKQFITENTNLYYQIIEILRKYIGNNEIEPDFDFDNIDTKAIDAIENDENIDTIYCNIYSKWINSQIRIKITENNNNLSIIDLTPGYQATTIKSVQPKEPKMTGEDLLKHLKELDPNELKDILAKLNSSSTKKEQVDMHMSADTFKPFVVLDNGMHYLEDNNEEDSETPDLNAIQYEVQGTVEDELDDPEEINESEIDNLDDDQLLSVRIWDKNTGEDSTPQWLYTLLNDKIFANSDDFSESMECTYIMNVLDFKNFINYLYGNHKFRVIKYTDKQAKANPMTMWDDDFLKDHKVCFIYDANEEFLPDTTPEWLYDILNGSPSMAWSEFMESIFEVDNETYEYLINHPDCVESRDATNAEAFGDGATYDMSELDMDNYFDDIILNDNYKVKPGGRTAPKGGKDKLDTIKEDLYDAFDNKLNSVRKDFKYDVDTENIEFEFEDTTKSGVDYIACTVGGDWEEPVALFIYWDGKKYRGYMPTRGNAVNTINKSAFGNDEDADNEYGEKYLNLDNLSQILEDVKLSINWTACREEFEQRLKAI